MTEEIYPMPFFVMLMVSDVEASSSFYQNTLGFKHIFTIPDPDGQPRLVHLRWAKYADLLVTKSRDGKELSGPKGAGITLNFNMFENFNGDMDDFARHAQENGANVKGPIDRPWNVREVTVLDLDGYTLVFTTPIHLNLSFDEVIERARREESQ